MIVFSVSVEWGEGNVLYYLYFPPTAVSMLALSPTMRYPIDNSLDLL